MHLVPETRVGKITFYRIRLPYWAEDPASIGLTPESVDQLQSLADEAKAAYEAHYAAEQAAKSATATFHDAVKRMHAGGAGIVGGAAMIQSIKAYANTTGDKDVYARAMIDAPAKPGRAGSAPRPGTPNSFRFSVDQTGELKLIWKCKHPSGSVGTTYWVRRKLDGGDFVHVGIVGEKKFLDLTLPPGTKTCTYEVTALRSTGKGKPACYPIEFGSAYPMSIINEQTRRLVA